MADEDKNKRRGHMIGDEKLCRITVKAAEKFNEMLIRQNCSEGALRLAVVGGGIAGLKFKVEQTEGPTSRDVLVVTQNVKLVIDLKSARFISGSLLDLNPETNDFEVRGKF